MSFPVEHEELPPLSPSAILNSQQISVFIHPCFTNEEPEVPILVLRHTARNGRTQFAIGSASPCYAIFSVLLHCLGHQAICGHSLSSYISFLLHHHLNISHRDLGSFLQELRSKAFTEASWHLCSHVPWKIRKAVFSSCGSTVAHRPRDQ